MINPLFVTSLFHFFYIFTGIQGSFWTETVRTADQMYRMLFPRLLAVAERAWHKAPWENIPDKKLRARERSKDWVKFANTVAYRELGRLDQLGIPYHVTPPGARLVVVHFRSRGSSTVKGAFVASCDVTFKKMSY